MKPVEFVECLDPLRIRPVNPPQDQPFFERLVRSMRRGGWLGRPLLVVPTGEDSYQALTGSHRIAAAKKAGLETIPVIVTDERETALIKESPQFPNYPQGVAQHLFEHEESWLGRYIMLDDWTRHAPRPWTREQLQILEELGHGDMVEIMSVKRWECPR